MPANAAIANIYAGDTLTMPFTLSDTNGPLNLSGWTWRAMWRPKAASDTVIELAVDATTANVGHLVISATPEQTQLMVGNGVWDLEGTLAGSVRTFLRGNTAGVQDVSRG